MNKCKWHKCQNILEIRNRKFCSSKCRNKFGVDKRRRALKLLAIEYKGGKCAHCAFQPFPEAMDFHHINPDEKDFAIGSSKNLKSWKRIKKELDKCILLCANCHRIEHARISGRQRATLDDYEFLYDENGTLKNISKIKSDKPNFSNIELSKPKISNIELSKPKIRINKTYVCCECNKPVSNKGARCVSCSRNARQKIIWPTNSELQDLLCSKPRTHVAKQLGVSDNAILKHCLTRGIDIPRRNNKK